MKRELPLVSILIPNYNHSGYLDQCIQSAINQTYPNKEIILLDNSSQDNSVQVAAKYQDQGVIVCRNEFNVMNFSYKILANVLAQGKYFILLCADDYIMPDFIEKAIAIMEMYPNVGYVHGERDFVTPEDQLIELDPFYKCSFVAPGRKTMPVYMVTTVAHPAQGVIRKSAFLQSGGYDMEIDHMNADRSLWFYLSYENDAAYIKEIMCRIRVGSQTETVITQENFQHPILCHLTIMDYVNYAKEKNLPEVYKREQEALTRLAKEFVGYAGGMLYRDNMKKATAYLDYATIVDRGVVDEQLYKTYRSMIEKGKVDKLFIENQVNVSYQHKRSYEPPEEYEEIIPEDIVAWMKQEYRY